MRKPIHRRLIADNHGPGKGAVDDQTMQSHLRVERQRRGGQTRHSADKGVGTLDNVVHTTPGTPTDTLHTRISFAPRTAVVAEHVFHCKRDGNVAGTIRFHKNPGSDGLTLVITSFVCEQIGQISASMGAMVQELLRRGDIEGLYRIDREYVPFYCPRCDAIFCGKCWRKIAVYADDYPGWFEEMRGVCPNGHERCLND